MSLAFPYHDTTNKYIEGIVGFSDRKSFPRLQDSVLFCSARVSLSVTKITMYRDMVFTLIIIIISNCILLTVCENNSFIMKINATKRTWYKHSKQNGKFDNALPKICIKIIRNDILCKSYLY